MLIQIGDIITSFMDYLLGWLLYLPRDVMLFAVAILTSVILAFARRVGSDQDWLRRAAADRKRLASLARQARAVGDKPAAKRHKGTIAQIKARSLKYEFKPLLWAVLPILLVATWCFSRLGFHPPAAGGELEVRVYVPRSAVGRVAQLVPQQGLTAEGGWLRPVVMDTYPKPAGAWDRFDAWAVEKLGMKPPLTGVAKWRLRVPPGGGRRVLKILYDGRVYEKQVLFGSRKYAPAMELYGDGPVQAVELVMRPMKLFGLVGGLLFLPPWLVAYLLIAIPFVSVVKRLFGIY